VSGPEPLLLLHGQPGSAGDWDRLITALGPGTRTIAVDRPGWDGVSKPCGLECNSEAALGALERAGVARATVVGYSLGGTVAAWLAATHPERLSRLVLIAPAANVESLVALDHLLAAPIVGELTSALAVAVASVALGAPRLLTIDSWRSFLVEQRMLIRELPLLKPLLGQIAAPTTIVVGTADRIVPPSSARALARQIPGAELVEIDRANHLLVRQQTERLAEILLAH
jgi:pimeloyl-ACP methyl ester carboxylesterase